MGEVKKVVVAKKSSAGKSGNKRQRSGRVKRRCERYRMRGMHQKNQARGLIRHLRRQPGDLAARRYLANLYDANTINLSSRRDEILALVGDL